MSITIDQINQAAERLEKVITRTPLEYSKRLSKLYKAHVYLKREDLQEVRSFKIRGAYNKMASLTPEERKRGVVCASAGNHAQGVAYSCFVLKIKGVIFMPVVTPNQKIEKVKHFGDGYVQIKLIGNTYDEASKASKQYCKEQNAVYVHPFDDPFVIAGQGTVGKEIWDEIRNLKLDFVIVPIGGGGLISGVSSYLRQKQPHVKIIGVEPLGSPSMYESLRQNKIVTIDDINTFVDGAVVATPGNLTFAICKNNVEKVILIPEGKDCTTMIELYQNEGIIAEPAGALAISGLDMIADEIKGKTVVCVLSGGNNDILRYPDIMEKKSCLFGTKTLFSYRICAKARTTANFFR